MLAFPGFAAAQASASSDSVDTRANAHRALPTIMAMAADSTVSFRPARPEIAPAVRRKQSFDRSTVLMIVGGALIVTGVIVDDDASTILYLAGAGIGGYGLYLYLQRPDTRLTR
jgi:hypothetical protein